MILFCSNILRFGSCVLCLTFNKEWNVACRRFVAMSLNWPHRYCDVLNNKYLPDARCGQDDRQFPIWFDTHSIRERIDSYQMLVTAVKMIGHLSGSRHCGVTADTSQGRGPWQGPRGPYSRYMVCGVYEWGSTDHCIAIVTCKTEGTGPRLSHWALFWLSDSCPNKYSNMAIVGMIFSNGNVIWSKCD